MNKDFYQFIAGLIVAATIALFVPLIQLPVGATVRDHAGCGSIYQVVSGDTLHEIAVKAYGAGKYEVIFEANRDILSSDSRIEIGDELLIPCLDGVRPRVGTMQLARAPVAGAGQVSRTPSPGASAVMSDHDGSGGDIAFVTGSDFAPFVHPALPEGGMVTELVRLAVADADNDRDIHIALVEDWSAHPGLIEDETFDLGFPWYRPDCSRVLNLGASMRRRCAGFDFSAPLFEVEIGYYVRAGDPLAEATVYERLSGSRICRPANYFTFDLEQEGLPGPATGLVIAPAAADCFRWLEQGKVDVVTLSEMIAVEEITRLGLDSRVDGIPELASVQTMHVVAPKGNAKGRAYLDLIDGGLADLRASGRWFEVVSRHFGTYGVRVR